MFKYSFFRYGLIGVYSVILDYIMLFLLFSILGISQNISITLAFFGSSVFNFYMHKMYTFNSKTKSFTELVKYIILVTFSYFITLSLINFLVTKGVDLYLSKLITVLIVYIYGYIISKFFIYKRI